MITARELRSQFLDFFRSKEHAIIPSASLIPDNDPTTLFITAGMHPLVPYLLGQPHPEGKRLADVQKSLRTTDIEEVGDRTHFTFFEMLGNWSLGDYFKREAITWSWEFLTSPDYLGLEKEKLFVSVFAGDDDAPRDSESAAIWKEIFERDNVSNPEKRIYFYPKSENWWGPAGVTGPCGPDTEIFYYTGSGNPFDATFSDEPAADVSDFIEVWNNVFMQFNKTADGKYEPLVQNNVDTGLGLERMTAIINWIQGKISQPDPYRTSLFTQTLTTLADKSGANYDDETKQSSLRIICDHLRAATFIVQDGVQPSNKERGYILRRLIRRAVREMHKLGIQQSQFVETTTAVIHSFTQNSEYNEQYPEILNNETNIVEIITVEVDKFSKSLNKGLREVEKYETLDGEIAFQLYQTYGFPFEMTEEIARERGQEVSKGSFQVEFKKHQELSRDKSAQTFKGGLADHSENTTRYHTATHLLHAALRQVLGEHVHQEGSNITQERLRFDFAHDSALTEDQLRQVENWINDKISQDLPVSQKMMPKQEALDSGAMAFFQEKYPDIVSVYTIGEEENWISRELCGGPHVSHTGEIPQVEIFKQKAVSAGARRVYLRFRQA